MKQTLLLFLSVDRLHAQLMSKSMITAQQDFPGDQIGYESFASFLQNISCPTFMLVDLIEEDFRQEVVPHLNGPSRTALFKRKFEQFYRGTSFHQATLLQRHKTGRRDDDILFSALTNPSLITPWLDILNKRQIPLAGIYSVPQISAPLVKNHPSKHLLLISWGKYSGLRQTYFSNHRLQISRLTPIHAEQTFSSAVVKELARTYQYLKSLSLLPAGHILDVRILCHHQDLEELKSHLPQSDDMHYDFADIGEVGRQLKIAHSFNDSDASQIFMHQLLARRPKSHYANAEHTHYFTIWQLRNALNWGAGILLVASIIWGLLAVVQSGGDESETESLKIQAQRTLQEAETITKTLPPYTTAPADMKSAVDIVNKLTAFQPPPQVFLQPLSAALNLFPQIQLTRIDWSANPDEPVADNTNADVPAQVISLKGSLIGFDNSLRTALTYLDRFQLDLGKRGYHVDILTQPLDVSPGGSLANRSDTRENNLEFSMKLAWRPVL